MYLNNAFANLENENLFVEIIDKKDLNFQEENIKLKSYKKSSGGLSTGVIIAIIISCVVIPLAEIGVGIYFIRKRSIKSRIQNNPIIVPNTYSSYVSEGINN